MKNIRNFCIIAHIDHGKSTLSDRILELTGTVEKRKMKEQLLDQMDLERERGITIKLQPVKIKYNYKKSKSEVANQEYTLNLIDTPGHVDFGYEVSRSLAAVEGAILLVDSTKGVQAQTLSNLYLAIEQGLEIIPVMNKIDLPNSDIDKTKKEIIHILGCDEKDILSASGKTGEGVEKILEEIVEKIPVPEGELQKPLRAMIFDSKYDTYKGVLAYVRIVDGEVKREDRLLMMATQKESVAIEVGSFRPELTVEDSLKAGDIGYIATGFKSVEHCRVGDTVTLQTQVNANSTKKSADGQHRSVSDITPLDGYKEVSPMVYASLYPLEGDDYNFMRDSLSKLKLNDAAFVFEPESNPALGRGFRCGFLGMLHLEIVQARLEREFNISPTITTPSVVYEVKSKGNNNVKNIYSPIDMPDPSLIEEILEPYVKLDIVTPAEYMGSVMELLNNTRSEYRTTEYIDEERVLLGYYAPLTDVIINFHDDLKSASSGFASMNYELIGYRASNLVKMDIMVAGEQVDAFSRIVPKENAFREGKAAVKKLKESIPRQNFVIALQAVLGGKVIARETISAFRKDVTAGMYGGDVTRKRKLLEKQKKGKKKMKNIGSVSIPPEAFLNILRK